MFTRPVAALFATWLVFVAAPLSGLAQTTSTQESYKQIGVGSDVKPEVLPSLIVLNARNASLQGATLTLHDVSQNAIIFADRPSRLAGHALTTTLLEEWRNNGGSFAKDPPNATVSVLTDAAGSAKDAVVVLKSPKLDGDDLTFSVQVLEGGLTGANGPAAVFIDIIGLPFTPLSVAGVARRTAARTAFYSAAAANAYYHPYAYPYPYPPPPRPCGYYPYPPCY